MTTKEIPKDIIFQSRCIYCKREQYAPAVFAISNGEHPCVWCGKTPPIFTDIKDYANYLHKQKEDDAKTK